MGSGCGTVGREVASEIKVPGFESNHRILKKHLFSFYPYGKDQNDEKEAWNGPNFDWKNSSALNLINVLQWF